MLVWATCRQSCPDGDLMRRQLVGPSFLFGAPTLASVHQCANPAQRCCQQVGKPRLGSCGLLAAPHKLVALQLPSIPRPISKQSKPFPPPPPRTKISPSGPYFCTKRLRFPPISLFPPTGRGGLNENLILIKPPRLGVVGNRGYICIGLTAP